MALLCAAQAACAAALTPRPWTEYLGSQGAATSWASTVRGEPPASLAPGLEYLVPLDFGIRSGKDARSVRALVADMRGDGREKRIHDMTRRIVELERRAGPGRLHWQVGNEINSAHLARSLGAAVGAGDAGTANDPRMVGAYVDFLFVPALVALRAASRELHDGDPERLSVVLGTLANARRDASLRWLDALLARRVSSPLDPELAGTRVVDHVSQIALHYLVTNDRPRWEPVLLRLQEPGGGRLRGVWATEELGKRRAEAGLGAATAVRVASSCLGFAASRALGPESLRCSFFGWRRGPAGTTADDGMRLFAEGLGIGAVELLESGVGLEHTGELEVRVLREPVSGRRIATVFGRGESAGMFLSLTLPRAGRDPAGALQATLLEPGGARNLQLLPEASGATIRYRPADALRIGRTSTLLVRDPGPSA